MKNSVPLFRQSHFQCPVATCGYHIGQHRSSTFPSLQKVLSYSSILKITSLIGHVCLSVTALRQSENRTDNATCQFFKAENQIFMVFQNKFPATSESKDIEGKRVAPWWTQRKQTNRKNYNYHKTKNLPLSTEHVSCSTHKKQYLAILNKNNAPVIQKLFRFTTYTYYLWEVTKKPNQELGFLGLTSGLWKQHDQLTSTHVLKPEKS